MILSEDLGFYLATLSGGCKVKGQTEERVGISEVP
jgi:hypothetical protein